MWSAYVRLATLAKLSRTSRSGITHDDDDAIIEEASSNVVTLVTEHRRAVARWRRISERLAATLESLTIHEDNADRFARSLNSGIDALSKVVRLERQAYNLDDERTESLKTFEELMREVAPEPRE